MTKAQATAAKTNAGDAADFAEAGQTDSLELRDDADGTKIEAEDTRQGCVDGGATAMDLAAGDALITTGDAFRTIGQTKAVAAFGDWQNGANELFLGALNYEQEDWAGAKLWFDAAANDFDNATIKYEDARDNGFCPAYWNFETSRVTFEELLANLGE